MWKDVAVADFKIVSWILIRKSENQSRSGAMGIGTPKYGAEGVSRSSTLTLRLFVNSSTTPDSTAALAKLMWPWNITFLGLIFTVRKQTQQNKINELILIQKCCLKQCSRIRTI
jgi:hypothetical protein